MKKNVYLFRHGETDWNAQGRFQGHLDIPLNERGREQARSLIVPLREHGIEAIFSSDLSRAHETARLIATSLNIPVLTHEGLREAHLGEAQGLDMEQIRAKFGDRVLGRWRSNLPTDADVSYNGGETGAQVLGRVTAALEKLLAEHDFSSVGISTHGGVIRRFMHRILPPGTPPVSIPNGVLYALVYDSARKTWQVR